MNNENFDPHDEGRRRFIGTAIAAIPGAAVVTTGLLASEEVSAQTKTSGPVKQPAVIGYPNNKGVTIERVTYPARNMVTDFVAYILGISRNFVATRAEAFS